MPFDILDPTTLIIVLASIGAFLTILAFGMPLLARDNFSSRLKAVAKRREELQAAQKARVGPKQSRLRQTDRRAAPSQRRPRRPVPRRPGP